jgi:hypothetical protein
VILFVSCSKIATNALWLYLVAENTRPTLKLKTMKKSTKPTSNEAECGNKSKPLLCDVLINCKENTVVAFKEKERNEWFTGVVNSIFEPHSKYNASNEFFISIYLSVPIEPQWYNGEKTVYYLEDISDLVVLENIT